MVQQCLENIMNIQEYKHILLHSNKGIEHKLLQH